MKEGMTVLVTGAAHGLGEALCRVFLDAGWTVIGADIDDLSLAWLLQHGNALAVSMDVTSDVSVAKAFTSVQHEVAMLDLIINNAGIDRYFPLSEAPVGQFREIMEVNVFGAYRVNQVFLPLLRRPGGRIIHIGSESLNLTTPFMPYPLTKKLLEGYARVLRNELRFLGIDVVVIRPGAIRTRLVETVSRIDPAAGGWKLEKPFRKFAGMASREIGRLITPEQAAAFIYKAARIPHPAAVYRINNMLQLKIAAWLPDRLVENFIYRKLK